MGLGFGFFPKAPQKGSRFKVGVQGSRGPGVQEMTKSRSVCVCKRSQSVRKRPRVSRILRSRETGVLVAKRRTVVTFGLAPGPPVSKVSTVAGIRGGPGRETQNCRHFWTCSWSSRLKSVNSHLGRGSGPCVAQVSTVTGIGGVLVVKRRPVVAFGASSREELRGEERSGDERKREEKRRAERG